jgi:hypothetical protein
VVLTPRRWRQVSRRLFREATVARKPGHRGERDISVKTIAQGRPGETGEPVVTTLVCFIIFAREAAGAAGTRLSLRPLFRDGVFLRTARAHGAAGKVDACRSLKRFRVWWLHPSRRIAKPVIERAFARPVGDAPQDEVLQTLMVRSAASRVSNQEARERAIMIPLSRKRLQPLPLMVKMVKAFAAITIDRCRLIVAPRCYREAKQDASDSAERRRISTFGGRRDQSSRCHGNLLGARNGK